ncbi:hypothetical protein [Candidatus Methanoperedens nitratireducens]|nr:hypothetical protein [Candidatus Methanoperedens nitroreducens]
MSRSVTLSDEAIRKLFNKKKIVSERTGRDDPSISDIICYVCQHCKE